MKRFGNFSRWLCLVMILAMALASGYAFAPRMSAARGEKDAESPFADVKKDDIVTFGTYEQDDLTRNGEEDIEWIVLAVEGDQALLLSRYCLDCMSFHFTGKNGVNWEESDLRAWMNEEFYEDAFTDEEKEWICLTDVPNGKNETYGRHENDTRDHVFALSLYEVREYLTNKRLAAAKPTEYALGEGIQQNASNHCSWWWLRTGGSKNDRMNVVFSSGVASLDKETKHVTDAVGGVRPAMWVDIG